MRVDLLRRAFTLNTRLVMSTLHCSSRNLPCLIDCIFPRLVKGSFATVVSAIERATGDTYAVKIIHRNKFKAKNSETMKMFLREISILEGLDHPNICRLKDAFFGETICE